MTSAWRTKPSPDKIPSQREVHGHMPRLHVRAECAPNANAHREPSPMRVLRWASPIAYIPYYIYFPYIPCLLHRHPLSRYLHIVAARIISADQHCDRRPRKILVTWSVSQVLATKRVHSPRSRIRPLGDHPPVIAIHRHMVDA